MLCHIWCCAAAQLPACLPLHHRAWLHSINSVVPYHSRYRLTTCSLCLTDHRSAEFPLRSFTVGPHVHGPASLRRPSTAPASGRSKQPDPAAPRFMVRLRCMQAGEGVVR